MKVIPGKMKLKKDLEKKLVKVNIKVYYGTDFIDGGILQIEKGKVVETSGRHRNNFRITAEIVE